MARKGENEGKRSKRSKKRHKRAALDLVGYRQMYALSKKARVQILAILAERVASPKELADELNEGLSQVSYHVSVLRECKLIELVGKEPRRGAVEHFYKAAIPTLTASTPMDELPPLGLLRTDGVSAPVLLAALPLVGGSGGGRKGAGRKGSR
jgi:DNA-binding transcriptional ArsR family regulator